MTSTLQNINLQSANTQQALTPACFITDLENNIILSNIKISGGSEEDFMLNGCKVSVTRFWSSSTAYFTFSQNSLELQKKDQLPAKIGLEDQIIIYMGYLPENYSSLNVVDKDYIKNYSQNVPYAQRKLARVYVGIIEVIDSTFTGTGGLTYSCQCRDRMKWLMDTVTTFDPIALINASDDELKESELKNFGLSRAELVYDCARYGILAVDSEQENPCGCGVRLRKGVFTDLFQNQTFEDGKPKLEEGTSFTNWYENSDLLAVDPYDEKFYKPLPLFIKKDSIPEGGQVNQLNEENPDKNSVAFNIYTTRDTLNVQQRRQFIIAQQIPAEMIKFLALQESYPTELFQSNLTGQLFYAPRGNSSQNLIKDTYNYRTFFVGSRPSISGVEPEKLKEKPYDSLAAAIKNNPSTSQALAFKEEMASIGLKTNIIIRSTSQVVNGTQGDFVFHLQTNPFELRGKNFACKTMIYQDETLSNATEATVVAVNLARILSKETRASTLNLVGDASLVPGEIIQVAYASFNRNKDTTLKDEPDLSGSAYPTFLQLVNDRLVYETAYGNTNQSFIDMVQRMRDAASKDDFENVIINEDQIANKEQVESNNLAGGNKITLPNGEVLVFHEGTDSQKNPTAVMCENRSFIFNTDAPSTSESQDSNSKNNLGYKKEPQTIWRIEAVIHDFNSSSTKGYTTSLALTSPF